MESLGSLTDELRRKINLDCAWTTLSRSFDGSKPRRYVSGIVVSSSKKNANGDAFVARGVSVTLPTPFLRNHDWLHPIGKVIEVKTREDQILFTAEIANSGRQLWVEDAWMNVMCRFETAASIGPRNLANHDAFDHTYYDYGIDEISLAERGADPAARILRVWQLEPVVHLHRPSIVELWNTP